MNSRIRSLSALPLALLIAAPIAAQHQGHGFQVDFLAAKAQAAAEGKDILVEFTGSDWCPPCKALHKHVFSKSAFVKKASEKFVLIELDFPNKEQPEVLKKQNEVLRDLLPEPGGFPTVMLMDSKGQPYESWSGYAYIEGEDPVDQFLELLDQEMESKNERDAKVAAAESAKGGEDKLKLLREAIELVPEEFREHQFAIMGQMAEIDSECTEAKALGRAQRRWERKQGSLFAVGPQVELYEEIGNYLLDDDAKRAIANAQKFAKKREKKLEKPVAAKLWLTCAEVAARFENKSMVSKFVKAAMKLDKEKRFDKDAQALLKRARRF